MSQTVALTGASGFIGHALTTSLREKGHQVRALLRSESQRNTLEALGVEIVKGLLENPQNLEKLVQGCNVLVHCAGTIKGRHQEDFYQANVSAIFHLIQACRTNTPYPKIILISSLAAREPSISPYAWSKRQGELTLIREASDLSWVIFRPPAVYGPKDKSLRPLFRLMKYGIGVRLSSHTSKFSLIHVEDLARAIIEWIETEGVTGHILEVDDGFPGGYTWDNIFQSGPYPIRLRLALPAWGLKGAAFLNEKTAHLFGYLPLLTKGKVAELLHPNWVCNTGETLELLNWRPQISLKTGLHQLLTSDSLW